MLPLKLIQPYVRLLTLLLIAFLSLPAQAKTSNEFRLSEFYGGNSLLRLNGERPVQDLGITLSPLLAVSSATLHLKATSSITMLQERSILNVRFNNVTIGQITLNPNKPNLQADVRIPSELWRPQYNTLTFAASQYVDRCQDSNAPDLWSEINLYNSYIAFETTKVINQLNLQKLSDFFNPGIGGQHQAQIFTLDNKQENDIVNKYAIPAVAQALALRTQYQSLHIDYQNIESKAADTKSIVQPISESKYRQSSWYITDKKADDIHVLIGTKNSLQQALSEKTLEEINGPYLRIEKTPAVIIEGEELVASHIRLIVSGLSEQDVVRAATTLAYMDDRLNPDQSINVHSTVNNAFIPQQQVTLQPGKSYTLSELGVTAINFNGPGLLTKKIEIRLPADFYASETDTVELTLDFSYGAGYEDGSTFNITVNGKVIHGLKLDKKDGDFYHNYTLSIPARLFDGGKNELAFHVNQNSIQLIGECRSVNGDYLHFQLDTDSKIELPTAAHLARQPDLRLLGQTGYPFAQYQTQDDTGIYITQATMRSAALTMAGKLAQSSGNLIPNLYVEMGIPTTLTDTAMVLATPKDLSAELYSDLSTAITDSKRWPYRLQNKLYNRVTANDNQNLQPNTAAGFTTQQSTLGDFSLVLATKNPVADKTGTLFIIAAETTERLTERISELVQGPLWSQLAGDFFAWDNAKSPLIVMQVSSAYMLGATDSWTALGAWGTNHPWYLLLIIVAIVFMFMVFTWLLLKRRHQKIKEDWKE
ncbi:cellulose biosynthesis cyclic di-GMP-binding regulatory protein BcsB [Psychromonas sp. B3M02]|uniref:cellulose biosynthesis cyclic di-GMP-binding regulatory protein BcsB n=1 Tax=Psychromonas sp. B3M02 TaxID=2267226 RepID=UPI000DE80ACE|nr:cellulose biosynthesis cyclic di-GMP-binding regulatory protein BcsB [Psychromonas sp. B3M02]RBW46743.1 cellulose biosynthesis cyclic di-GMP-binding regulatory protein BcsB [Psychromonas sp. B3M02]